MALRTTPTSRCLDKKVVLFGFEVMDLLVVFLLLAILNIAFSGTRFEFYLGWGLPAVLAIFLRVIKKGKPEGYLLHFLRFHLRPKELLAFPESTHWKRLSEIHRK